MIGAPRSTVRYTARENDDKQVVREMTRIIEEHPNYGCRTIGLKLRNKGMAINHKRVERLYRKNNLQLGNRTKGRRKKYIVPKRDEHLLSKVPGEWMAMDFVIDSVGNRRKLKMLTVIDPVTKEVPQIQPGFSMTGCQVVEQLEDLKREHGQLKYLQTDNGPEFRSYEVEKWCEENNVRHVFSRPGKPTDNCFIESFNRILRQECLDIYYFASLDSARRLIEKWRIDYNTERPQKGLDGLTPYQYRDRLLKGT